MHSIHSYESNHITVVNNNFLSLYFYYLCICSGRTGFMGISYDTVVLHATAGWTPYGGCRYDSDLSTIRDSQTSQQTHEQSAYHRLSCLLCCFYCPLSHSQGSNDPSGMASKQSTILLILSPLTMLNNLSKHF